MEKRRDENQREKNGEKYNEIIQALSSAKHSDIMVAYRALYDLVKSENPEIGTELNSLVGDIVLRKLNYKEKLLVTTQSHNTSMEKQLYDYQQQLAEVNEKYVSMTSEIEHIREEIPKQLAEKMALLDREIQVSLQQAKEIVEQSSEIKRLLARIEELRELFHEAMRDNKHQEEELKKLSNLKETNKILNQMLEEGSKTIRNLNNVIESLQNSVKKEPSQNNNNNIEPRRNLIIDLTENEDKEVIKELRQKIKILEAKNATYQKLVIPNKKEPLFVTDVNESLIRTLRDQLKKKEKRIDELEQEYDNLWHKHH